MLSVAKIKFGLSHLKHFDVAGTAGVEPSAEAGTGAAVSTQVRHPSEHG